MCCGYRKRRKGERGRGNPRSKYTNGQNGVQESDGGSTEVHVHV